MKYQVVQPAHTITGQDIITHVFSHVKDLLLDINVIHHVQHLHHLLDFLEVQLASAPALVGHTL